MSWTSSIETIYGCPVVNGTRGIIRISPRILRILAGAVRNEKNEWLTVLLGTSDLNGLRTTVDDLYTPEMQDRDFSNCDVDENLYPFPQEVKSRMLGYLHSHHSMRPDFSSTDTGTGGFNQRGAISIVISSSIPHKEGPMREFSKMIGFSYSAVIRHKLQCGAWGKSYADIAPTGADNWPLAKDVVRSLTNLQAKNLGDCTRYEEGRGSTEFYLKRKARCGCSETETHTRNLIYGADGEEITSKLPRPSNGRTYGALPPPGQTLGKRYGDYRDETWDDGGSAAWREYLEDRYGKEAVQEALVRITD